MPKDYMEFMARLEQAGIHREEATFLYHAALFAIGSDAWKERVGTFGVDSLKNAIGYPKEAGK